MAATPERQTTSAVRLPALKLTATLIKSTVVAALGGLLFGFDTAVIAGTTAGLTTAFALTPSSLGLTVAMALVGTVVGSMLAGIPGDRHGRRDNSRHGGSLPYFRRWVRSRLGLVFAGILSFRRRVAIGGSSVLGPMYIAEISPAKSRGVLGDFFNSTLLPEF